MTDSRRTAGLRCFASMPNTLHSMLNTRPILITLAVAAGAAMLGGAVWYEHDRTAMLTAICKVGLPNLSRPSVVDSSVLGCAIVGPRRRVSGVLLTGFEASNLINSDLPPAPQGGGFSGSTWFECNQQKGCDKKLDKQLDQDISGLCGTGLAKITAFGWVTETPGGYGHMGIYARTFFVDEIIAIGPPPAKLVEEMRRLRAEAGMISCL
jgi:hypothetical protein